jgi:hypothetical protein
MVVNAQRTFNYLPAIPSSAQQKRHGSQPSFYNLNALNLAYPKAVSGADSGWEQLLFHPKKVCDALTSYVFSISAAKGGIDEFIVYLVTGGGNPGSGMELYNFFKARPERTTIYNMSSVDSAGVLFFLGFQKRFGLPASSFMVHQTKFSKASLPDLDSYSDLKKSEMELLAVDQKTHRLMISLQLSSAWPPNLRSSPAVSRPKSGFATKPGAPHRLRKGG